jgi:hypothetical protein
LSDVESIVHLVRRIRTIGKGRINVRVNTSTFVPKPHTPFQWVAQASGEELAAKQQVLRSGLKKAGVQLSWHDPEVSLLEGALSRGDRRLAKVIEHAWQLGSKFDAWSEHFSYEKWRSAFDECGLDPYFYACRERSLDEILPWAHIDTGISLSYLKREYERTKLGEETPNCRTGPCNACGLQDRQGSCQRKYRELTTVSKRSGQGTADK